jgi:hypothetical protein
MYSCNLICNGSVEKGEVLNVETLSLAVASGHLLFNSRFEFRGFEIWHDDALVYHFGEMASE